MAIEAHAWLNPVMDEELMQLPIDGVMDLHTFQPREVQELVINYVAECQTHEILRVRVIHGKVTEQLWQTIHSILERHLELSAFKLASEHSEAGAPPRHN